MVFSAEGKFKHKKNKLGMRSTKLDYCHDPTQTVTPTIKTVITKNDNYPPTIDSRNRTEVRKRNFQDPTPTSNKTCMGNLPRY